MLKIFSFFMMLVLNCKAGKKAAIKPYQIFYIKKINGQLSEKVAKVLNEKYWKSNSKENKHIVIHYEIFEFLDFLYVKCKITVNKKTKSFAIKYIYSRNEDWRHDDALIDEIAKTIHEQSNFLVCK